MSLYGYISITFGFYLIVITQLIEVNSQTIASVTSNDNNSKIDGQKKTTLGMVEVSPQQYDASHMKHREKRQQSNRYVEASRVSQLKLFRLFVQMLKNPWAKSYIGGAHPFHRDVPKAVAILAREKIIKFLSPDVGAERQNK